jgi:hypothetical protein
MNEAAFQRGLPYLRKSISGSFSIHIRWRFLGGPALPLGVCDDSCFQSEFHHGRPGNLSRHFA